MFLNNLKYLIPRTGRNPLAAIIMACPFKNPNLRFGGGRV